MATINGTALDDVLATTAGADTLTALGGNDVILVALGTDHGVGEKLDGGAGYDRLWFTGGTSLVLLSNTAGIEAVEIADAVGNANGVGAYNVNASALPMVATGFTLAGNDGANQLTGTAGKDLIIGNAGADTIVAGAGADRVVMSVTAGNTDDINAGALAELNTLVLVGAATATIVVDLATAGDQIASLALNQAGFTSVDASAVTVFGVQVTASALKNVIVGSAQNDLFLFGAPADLGLADVVSGGAGSDTLRFTSTTAGQILALSAAVAVETVEIADATGLTTGLTTLGVNASKAVAAIALTGNDGNNSISGGAFNDTINGNAGADSLAGGAGNDVYVVDKGADWVALDQILDATGKDDRIAFTSTTGGETLTLGAKVTGIEAVYISTVGFATTGTTALDVNGAALLTGMNFVGNAGANLLTGGKGNDSFTGNGGADTIVGGLGADTVFFDPASLTFAAVNAGAALEGNKLVLAGTAAGVQNIDLRIGVDDLLSLQDQYLMDGALQVGFANVDAKDLQGFGVDVALSSIKNLLVGSDVDDLFDVYAPTHLASTDKISGGAGNDTLRFASLVAGQTLTIGTGVTGIETVALYDVAGGVIGATNLNVNAAVAPDALKIVGNDGNNLITGTADNDTLDGMLGADTMLGGLGDDVFLYESSAQFVAGERISDAGGADVLKFAPDGVILNDVLVLSAAVTGIETFSVDADTSMAGGINAGALTYNLAMTGNDYANTLVGGTKDDLITGGKGDDSLVGGAGNDRLEGGEGIDSIVGGLGNDTISMDLVDIDQIQAGTGLATVSSAEKNLLLLKGDGILGAGTVIDFRGNLAPTTDQITSDAAIQSGFDRVDGSGITGDFSVFGGPVITVYGRISAVGDSIVGSPGPDIFVPGAGNDTIEGGGGNDTFIVYTQAELGNDVYNDSGGTLADYLFFAGTTATTYTVQDSNLNGVDVAALGDPLDFGSAAWTVNSSINATANKEPLSMAGNFGNNTLSGTEFGETFFDRGGADLMKGGNGNDEYVIYTNPWLAGDKIIDTGGFDQFYLAFPQLVVVTSAQISGVERFTVSGADINQGVGDYIRDITEHIDGGLDVSALGFAVNLAGSYGDNSLRGTNLGDTITMDIGIDDDVAVDFGDLSPDWDQIDAGAITEGNLWLLVDSPTGTVVIDLAALDQLVSIDGTPELLPQSGFLHVDASGVTLPANPIVGKNYGLSLSGTSVANKLIGSADADIIAGKGGADTLVGGAGNDSIAFASQAEFTGAASIDGGGGNDAIIFTSVTAGQTLIISSSKAVSVEKAGIADGAGLTTGTTALNLDASSITAGAELFGNDGDNSIKGGIGADTLTGNGGADTLNGGTGNDLYLVADGAQVVAGDVIIDAGGTDTLRFVSTMNGGVTLAAGMAGLEKVELWNGEDTLAGTLALDVDASALPNGVNILGNDNKNVITGSAFADTIAAGTDNDTIDAGAGADVITMLVTAADADDVNGGLSTAEGNKLILLGDPGGDMVWDLTNGTNQLITVNALAPANTYTNITSIDASGLTGTAAITVTATADLNVLIGTANNDIFITDTPLVAGEVITGGDGADVLQFNAAAGTLTLGALVTGIETVDFAAGLAALNINAAAVANALAINANDGDNSITGSLFADTIVGGLGADTINGLGGADVITVDVAVADTVNAGSVTTAEANKLILVGAAAADLTFNLTLTAGSQLAGGAIGGFTHLDASAMTGFGVNVLGSAAANEILGTAQADTLVGGLGADSIGVNGAAADSIDAGLVTEGNELVVLGSSAMTVDLGAVDQITSMAGNQGGFLHVDASALTAVGVNVTGSAAGNRITGSAQADTISGGAGADTITADIGGAGDTIDAGGVGEGDLLVITGDATATFHVDLRAAPNGDQLADWAGTQSDFQHVDASAMGAFGLDFHGNGFDNRVTGTIKSDTLVGGAGADTFYLGGGATGDGVSDRVIFEKPSDGANGVAAAVAFDRIKEFTPGQDDIGFTLDLKNGAFALNDISTANTTFDFAVNQKADFATAKEGLLITFDKSGLKTELGLTGGNFASVVTAINKIGVIANAGDDGLLLVQEHGGTVLAPIDRTGVYYYQESDGIANKVSAGELTLLGVVEAHITGADVAFF